MHAAADYHGIEGMRDTDQVIPTRELARWAKEAGIDWNALEDSAYDSLMGKASGAGVIFGNTGGCIGGGGQPKDLMKNADETRKRHRSGPPAMR